MVTSYFTKLFYSFEDKQERLKFLRLAAIFSFIIGVYSLLYPTKDVIFINLVGIGYLPYAKWATVFTVAWAVVIYSWLLDIFKRHVMFYVLCTFYASMTIIAATLFYLINDAQVYVWAGPAVGWTW